MPEFGSKKSKLFLLSNNWHIWFLGRADSKPGVSSLKFWPQNPVFGQIWVEKHSFFILIWHRVAISGYSSAAFYRWFSKCKVPIFLFYREEATETAAKHLQKTKCVLN